MATPDTDNQEILELLPWYFKGTLNAVEAERVRRHLHQHPELQAEAAATDALLSEIAEKVTVPMLTQDRVERMLTRIDNEPQQAAGSGAFIAKMRRWSSKFVEVPNYFPVAATAAMVLLAFIVFVPQVPSDTPDFRTFSEDRPEVSIQLQLQDNMNAADAQALFAEFDLSAEQQASGVYTVSLSGDTSVAELYGILQALRTDARVVAAKALTEED